VSCRRWAKKEVSSTYIGERLMEQLREVDPVAYVRFASVYRSFRDINEFFDELKHLLSTRDDVAGLSANDAANDVAGKES
jgi:transcriptional regulator NrdR family protein